MATKDNFYGLLPQSALHELQPEFPAYRGKQLLEWVYKHLRNPLEAGVNLPKDFKSYLDERFSFVLPELVTSLSSQDGSVKSGLKLEDGSLVESVLIPDKDKSTLCVSSQVGCSRACAFCATGKMGLSRSLEPHEITGQIILACIQCKPQRLTNIVFMGMGEPLDNLDNVLHALSIIQAPETLAFSPRRTTISTCGIVPGIVKLADSGVKTKLAVSLNSALEDKRSLLMPITKKYSLTELKQALLYYARHSTFRITFEYILIPDLNMGKEDIAALRRFVGDLPSKINFIPYNPVPGLPYAKPTENEIEGFMRMAAALPQAIMLRRSRGVDIFGACGQLFSKKG